MAPAAPSGRPEGIGPPEHGKAPMPQTESAPRDTSAMYGAHYPTVAALRVAVLDFVRRPYSGGADMLAMSVLSDAQELLALGRNEAARQHINVAKWIIANRAELQVEVA